MIFLQTALLKKHRAIPQELVDRDQWVLWKLERIIDKETGNPKIDEKTGEIKYTKVPYELDGKTKADATLPKTWTKYDWALNGVRQGLNDVTGIGYVVADDDPYTAIDLDDCIVDGVIQPEALDIVKKLDSYTEYSQSGDGLHIFVKGKKPGNRSKNSKKGIEMYDKERFIVMTGNHVEGTPTEINERQDALNFLYDMSFPNSADNEQANPVENQSQVHSDDELVGKIRNSKQGEKFAALYDKGDIHTWHNGDDSGADQALANILAWWTKNIDQIERIMRQSALYRPDKWDRKESKPYLRGRTIPEALQTVKGGYGEQGNFQLHVNEEGKSPKPKLIHNKEGNVKKIVSNLRKILLLESKLEGIGFNEFTQEVTVNGEAITDEFISDLRLSVDSKYYVTFTKEDVLEMVSSIAREKNSYHPIKQIVESKKWDGVPRVESLFIDYLGADDIHYTRSVARKWLAGAVARIYQPGIKMEIVPVLQGKQGIGKSTLAAKLGGEFFVDTLASLGKTKDDYQLLIGSWIIELGELASLNSTETEKIKSFISARFDKIRLPYAKITQKYYRTCVFIGTTNNAQFLNDLTGNRRFFPIPLPNEPKKDVFSLDNETIQQIWAEAYEFYKNGENLYLDDQLDEDVAEIYREQATEESLFFMHIDDYLEMKVPKEWNSKSLIDKKFYFDRYQREGTEEENFTINKTTAKEIAFMLDIEAKDRNAGAQIKKINLYMDNKEDWKKQSVYINGKTKQGFKRM